MQVCYIIQINLDLMRGDRMASQLTKTSKPLFSQHFLDRRIQELPEAQNAQITRCLLLKISKTKHFWFEKTKRLFTIK
jgi:hypothetical protein